MVVDVFPTLEDVGVNGAEPPPPLGILTAESDGTDAPAVDRAAFAAAIPENTAAIPDVK